MAKEHTKIEDYGFLSDTQTGALVSRDGCVDWLCFPRFDSPACFASLLGDKKNGHWRFFPEEKVETTRRRYRGETLILETEIETKSGAVRLIDFMPPRGENPDIIRIVEGLRGKVADADGADHSLRLRAHRAVGAKTQTTRRSRSDRRARWLDLTNTG